MSHVILKVAISAKSNKQNAVNDNSRENHQLPESLINAFANEAVDLKCYDCKQGTFLDFTYQRTCIKLLQ